MAKLTVLMYHRVDETERDYLTVSVADFKRQMAFVARRYHVIRLSQLLEHVRTGKPLPPRALLITFDDGYENNHRLAWPVLKELGIPFTVFLIAGFTGSEREYDGRLQRFVGKKETDEMASLAEYGYHGLEHLDLAALDKAGRIREVAGAAEKLKNDGIAVQPVWAYTYGSYPKKDAADRENLFSLLKENGIELAFRIGNRLNTLPLKNKYLIQRLDIRGNQSFLKFRLKLLTGKIF